jgi:dipeptidyl aminopeptidase/acylaminoacyl peptidase
MAARGRPIPARSVFGPVDQTIYRLARALSEHSFGIPDDKGSTPVTVYSVSTGELRQLGSVRAAHLTWSPDGSTLAYTSGENDPDELWLVDADGANERLLTHVDRAIHGIGPVWSPTGDRIAYQRLGGQCRGCGEEHEVVLVNVADGNQTVIEPPETDRPNGSAVWYPWDVTWSPDGTTLLYTAWSLGEQAAGNGGSSGVIAVPADTPSDATVLTDTDPVPADNDHRGSGSRCGAGNRGDADAVREPTGHLTSADAAGQCPSKHRPTCAKAVAVRGVSSAHRAIPPQATAIRTSRAEHLAIARVPGKVLLEVDA